MSRLDPEFLRAPLAHRALHDVSDCRPENSRAAIAAAMAHGYGIEIDLQLSRDGAAMVFHDYDLRRLTGQAGPVQQRDAAELGRISLLGGDEGIPALPEVLELVAGRVPLLIELKDQQGQMGQTDGRLEAATAVALRGYAGPVAVMSFNPEMMIAMRDLAPDVVRGIVSCDYAVDDWPLLRADVQERLRDIPDYERAGACFVSHQAQDLGRARVAELQGKGADVLCWTIRSPEEEAEARRVAQNITFEGYLPAIPA
ncbi:Glycerophosphoryl diester phosphodiesterase [Roseovarius sp. THAF9]|uniref:glycerophosphodiester phosphodiesterase family protein n=1 Tax=Roseovarius sp. THAF9 TaxID=2587847 RepID=UPI001267CCE9|nr:glycerophosphodiester phosphodiesterase family protein [Roseovarius sp. THAF9]QFT94666.1 Glycerophosphoryl diester phosphodiesterase [Roseovarius sp. THAF9]